MPSFSHLHHGKPNGHIASSTDKHWDNDDGSDCSYSQHRGSIQLNSIPTDLTAIFSTDQSVQ